MRILELSMYVFNHLSISQTIASATKETENSVYLYTNCDITNAVENKREI